MAAAAADVVLLLQLRDLGQAQALTKQTVPSLSMFIGRPPRGDALVCGRPVASHARRTLGLSMRWAVSAAGDLQTKMLPSAAHVTMFFPSGLMRTCAHPFIHTQQPWQNPACQSPDSWTHCMLPCHRRRPHLVDGARVALAHP